MNEMDNSVRGSEPQQVFDIQIDCSNWMDTSIGKWYRGDFLMTPPSKMSKDEVLNATKSIEVIELDQDLRSSEGMD